PRSRFGRQSARVRGPSAQRIPVAATHWLAPGSLAESARTEGNEGLSMSVRGLLVDDQRMMREGLCALLSNVTDIQVIGQASDGRAALDLVRTLSPDVVVTEVGMPELNGIETTRRIRSEYEGVQVVALSTYTDKRFVIHMLEAGACGYVLKIA